MKKRMRNIVQAAVVLFRDTTLPFATKSMTAASCISRCCCCQRQTLVSSSRLVSHRAALLSTVSWTDQRRASLHGALSSPSPRLDRRSSFTLYHSDSTSEREDDVVLSEDDRILCESRDLPFIAPPRASTLGVDERAKRLCSRLFPKEGDASTTGLKVTPIQKVMSRIQWDSALASSHFTVVSSGGVTYPFERISIPDRDVRAIQYKERIVWDKQTGMDFFSSESKDTITHVVQTYDEWKAQSEEFRKEEKLRTVSLLGDEKFELLTDALLSLREKKEEVSYQDVEEWIQFALDLFRSSDADSHTTTEQTEHGSLSSFVSVRTGDLESLDLLLDIVAIHVSDNKLQEQMFDKIRSMTMMITNSMEVKEPSLSSSSTTITSKEGVVVPELKECELRETFVRGSGPGGQKVNKTSNRVILVHVPTRLRVECQETRSLQQNRKLARKRLLSKLDTLLNGEKSKSTIQANKLARNKAKSKARHRSRLRDKKETREPPIIIDSLFQE